MSTLRISNIEAKADNSSPTVDEQLKFTNSTGDVLLHLDGRTSGITTVGINTTAETIKFDSNNNIMVTGIVTATEFHGTLAVGTSVTYGDNEKAYFGNGLDLQIYHDTNHSYIKDTGTGYLRIQAADYLQLGTSSSAAMFLNCEATTGSVYIAHNGNDKIQTTNTGAVVTGILTATTFKGDGSQLTGITGTTINNNANNRIITGSGTANTLEAETSLEWDGTDTLTVVHPSSYPNFKIRTKTGGSSFEILSGGNGPTRIRSEFTSPHSDADELVVGADSGTRGMTLFGATSNLYFGDAADNDIGKLQYVHSDNSMRFTVNTAERLRITSAGNVGIGTDNPQCLLDMSKDISGGVNYVDIRNHHATGGAALRVKTQGTYASPTYQAILGASDAGGTIRVGAVSNHPLLLLVNNTERLRIATDSNITQTIDSDGDGIIITAGDMKPMLTGNSNRSAHNNTIFGISGKWNNTEVGRIAFEAGADTTNKDDGKIRLYTRPSSGSLTQRLSIESDGHILPGADNGQDLGSSSKRWRDIYTGDLNLSNEGSTNDVDATWGNYTIQEGESDLFLINNRSGKKYKFNLTEVS